MSAYLPGFLSGMLFIALLIHSTFHPFISDETLPGPSVEKRAENRIQQRLNMVKREATKFPVAPEEISQSTAYRPATNTSRVKIQKLGKYIHKFKLTGTVFNEHGKAVEITSKATSSALQNLSPRIEKEAAKSVIDPAGDQVFFVLAPAMQYFEGKIHLVTRIWLNKERYVADFFIKKNMKRTLNDIQDNWLYTETLNTALEPVTYGQILGIPMDKKLEMSDGTLEPRMFQIRDRLFITFNANIQYPGIGHLDTTFLYDLQRHDVFIPNITGLTKSATQDSEYFPTDKAWMALIQNDELYFVHNLDPLYVMKCDLEAKCYWVHKQQNKNTFIHQNDPYVGSLRGGSPFEHYFGNYYISVAHNTLRKGTSYKRFYTTHLILLYARAPSTYRIVYISGDLEFHPRMMTSIEMQATKKDDMDESFLFPLSLIIESQDSIIIGGHINDVWSIILRVEGLESHLKKVIEVDERLGPRDSPPIGYLQRYLRDMHATKDLWFV